MTSATVDRRRRPRGVEPAREVARRGRHPDAPAQARQRRGHPARRRARRRGRARTPAAASSTIPAAAHAGGEDGERQRPRHQPSPTRAMRLMSTQATSWQTAAAPSSHGASGARSSATT